MVCVCTHILVAMVLIFKRTIWFQLIKCPSSHTPVPDHPLLSISSESIHKCGHEMGILYHLDE